MTNSFERKSIHLALQGGGSHGAFTWGVLDRILEDDRITIEAFSGTSAGAMNAVVAANGLIKGGRRKAVEALSDFWYEVAKAGYFSPLRRSAMQRWFLGWGLESSPLYHLYDVMSRFTSPYELNPLGLNPLNILLQTQVDIRSLRNNEEIKIYVAATNVRTGTARIFRNSDLSYEAISASACLPTLFRAVEIDGEAYWDGGYQANPLILPAISECRTRDHVIVQIEPIERNDIPRSAKDIIGRINEITFNSGLIKDLETVAMLRKFAEENGITDSNYTAARFHRIEADDQLKYLKPSTKQNTEWAFLKHLHEIGYRSADQWIKRNYESLGCSSTMDLELMAAA